MSMKPRTQRDYRAYLRGRAEPGEEPSRLVTELSPLFVLQPPEGCTKLTPCAAETARRSPADWL